MSALFPFSRCAARYAPSVLAVLALLASAWFVSADDSVPPGALAPLPNRVSVELGPFLEYLSDHSGSIPAQSLFVGAHDASFTPLPPAPTGLGFRPAPYWLRFSFRPPPGYRERLLFDSGFSMLDRVDVFFLAEDGAVMRRSAGDTLAFEDRELKHRAPVFRLPYRPGQVNTVYMRVLSGGTVHFPFRLWRSADFAQDNARTQMLFGTYYGLMLATAAAAFLGSVLLRSWMLLAYGLYVSAFVFFQFIVNGFAQQYLWPKTPEFASHARLIVDHLLLVFATIFVSGFLQLKRQLRSLHIAFFLLLAYLPVNFILGLTASRVLANQMLMVGGIGVAVSAMLAALWILRGGSKAAFYFILGWGAFLCGVVITCLFYLGVLPYTVFGEYAMQIGSSLEIGLLSLAIATHYLKRDNERLAQAASQKRSLEHLVSERTQELEEKNRELSRQARRDSLTGLLNHSNIVKCLHNNLRESARYHFPISILMVDLDDFKLLNDRRGHLAGDRALVSVAGLLGELVRESDDCGRYGGEEFLVVLSHADSEAAKKFADRFREGLAGLKFNDSIGQSVTASVGIMTSSTYDPPPTSDWLIERADVALYRAKRMGKDRAFVYSDREQRSADDIIPFPR